MLLYRIVIFGYIRVLVINAVYIELFVKIVWFESFTYTLVLSAVFVIFDMAGYDADAYYFAFII